MSLSLFFEWCIQQHAVFLYYFLYFVFNYFFYIYLGDKNISVDFVMLYLLKCV